MFQKLDPEPGAGRCSFDDSGYIRQDEAAHRIDPDYAQVGVEGGERIIGNLWPGR